MAHFKKQKCRIEDLQYLWETVFGDSRTVTDAFFENAFYPDGCFYAAVDGKAVSALYLLPVTFRNRKGYYLYAAATLPEYRGKGLMRALIKEALTFAESNADFVYLCPAEASLYNYYRTLGFTQTLYARFLDETSAQQITDAKEMLKESCKNENVPLFLPGVYRYAALIGCKMYVGAGTQFADKIVFPATKTAGERAPYGQIALLRNTFTVENFFAFLTMN